MLLSTLWLENVLKLLHLSRAKSSPVSEVNWDGNSGATIGQQTAIFTSISFGVLGFAAMFIGLNATNCGTDDKGTKVKVPASLHLPFFGSVFLRLSNESLAAKACSYLSCCLYRDVSDWSRRRNSYMSWRSAASGCCVLVRQQRSNPARDWHTIKADA